MTEALPLSPSAVAEWVRPLYHFGVLHLPARKLAQLLANLGKNLIARMDERDGDILGAEILESLLADRAATTASVFRIGCLFCMRTVLGQDDETENSPSVLRRVERVRSARS